MSDKILNYPAWKDDKYSIAGRFLGLGFAIGIVTATISDCSASRSKFILPEVRDVNNDGIADIVLKRNNGKDLVFYETLEGNYIFEEKEAGERK